MGLSAPGKGSASALTSAGQTVLAAAIQFEPQIGDVPESSTLLPGFARASASIARSR